MKGAASRISALVIAVCTMAGAALAEGEVTDRDRVWRNFTREAAIVGDKHFWVELRGMALMDDQSIRQTDSAGMRFEGPTLGLNGFPLNASPKCTISETEGCVEQIDGSRFDLVGAYGLLSTLEVGFDFPFVMQQQVDFVGGGDSDDVGPGDLLLYGKFKRQLSEHIAGALGVEISAPTGSVSDSFGSGHTGLNPFISARYQSGPFALGSHLGFQLNTDDPPDVFNWSIQGIWRPLSWLSPRIEFDGRVFKDGGETFNDVAVWPGLDFNVTEHIIIRPQGLAHLSTDAINWGLGLGLAFTM